MNRIVYLLGFMGSGKSTVGRELAERLGWIHLDTDEMIESFTGRTIPDLFRVHGEASFRQLETRMLDRIRRGSENLVVSTGGGLPLAERNVRMMNDSGTTVALRVDPEEAYRRVADSDRPLAQDRKKFRDLWRQRQNRYDRADLQIDTSNRTPGEVTETILNRFDP